jgi:xanthine dehydrogenase molybdenum-binding subunit
MPEYSVLGKRLPRVDALDKATGRALYSGDISLPGMLYGKALRSPYAHAMIRRLDISRAQALKGVMAVITAADIPEKKRSDKSRVPRLAREKVVFAGQPIAVVAAINPYIAEEALGLIRVDYEELAPVMDALEALKPDATLIHPDMYNNFDVRGQNGKAIVPSNIAWHVEYERGDVKAGFKEADIILENTFSTQRVHQGYLETRSSVASVDPKGKITVWTDSQGLFQVRELCAEFLDIPLSHVRVMPIEVGGAFGAKQTQPLSPLCALLARKTGRPVKMVMTREEDFTATCPAPSSSVTLKIGVTKEGHITAALATLIWDVGAFQRESIDSLHGSTTGLSLYRIPNLNVKCYDVVTNKAPSGAYRAPNGAQAAFAIESQMDLLARALQMDPLEFRLRNAVAEGDHATDGATFPRIGFKETLQKMKEYLAQRRKPEGKNRGIGVACGLWYCAGGAFAAHVNVNSDGSVALVVGSCDLTGTRTSLAQIVAEEFGISFDQVTVITGDTDTVPYSERSSGSRTTRQMSTAVYRACQDAKDQLAQQVASEMGVKPDDLKFVNGQVQVEGLPEKSVPLAALARSSISRSIRGPVTGRGSVGGHQPSAPIFSVHLADVEVDKETGKVKVLSYAAVQDVGFAINPTLIEGQMQGAISQGIGWALMENYVFRQGVMQNPNLLDYRMPTAADLPFVDTMLVEVKSDIEPFGVRGVGEPPIVPSLATIANAIHSATGVRLKELPMTPEAVFYAVRTQEKLSMGV